MGIMSKEYQDRLNHWERTLKEDFYQPLCTIDFQAYTTMAHIPPEKALTGKFKPVKEGLEWGHTWEYMWLKSAITLPEAACGKTIVMNLDVGGEATLFVNGQAFGTRRAEWVNVPHHYMVDNFLTKNGMPGEQYELLFEAYAGHYFPDAGGCATGPVLPGSYEDPKAEGKRARIGYNSYGIWNEEAYQLWLDVTVLHMLFDELDDAALRKSHIADALEKFTLMVDFEQDAEGRLKDYRAARKMLKPYLQAHNGSTQGKMYAVGNAHLDLCWLWPQKETHRKTARTFAQQLRLIDKYPEYKYIQSQPAAYEMCREYYPELYERIKKAVKKGQWIAEGGMYVEPDTNMASGEALIRQLLYGKAFYKEELDIDSRLLWLPDTFGYTAALPQILKGCKVDYLVTQKIFWSYNDGDQFPYHYFTWKGMDGSEVTSFLPTSYTYRTDPKELSAVWNNRVQKRNLDDFLIPFGYGDGGGGPCADHIEYALRQKDLEGMPKVAIESPLTMFEDLEKKGGPKNTWEGELYFSAHRGTYTSQAAIKRNNRRSELMLRETEIWGTLAQAKGHTYQKDAMLRLWKSALLQQFHDILPGSSIEKVYIEANAAHADLQQEAQTLREKAQKALVKGKEGLTVFNSLPFERKVLVDVEGFARGAKTKEGKGVPTNKHQALVTLPAMGAVSIVPSDTVTPAPCAMAKVSAGGAVLQNDYVQVKLNAMGEITSYKLKQTDREYVKEPMNRFLLFKDVPRLFDAWDIDSNYIEQPVPLDKKAGIKLLSGDGLQVSVELTRKIGNSTLTQIISLDAHEKRVEFETLVEWNELHRLLKVAFPVRVQAQNAMNEMQFGYVERPTHRSRAYDKDRFEVCNHRYTALSDQNHGCAVLNDSKYGISVNGSSMELTLLRASASPQMRADNSVHRFSYAFTAWEGPFIDAPVVKEGYAFNVPATVQKGSLAAFSAFSVDRENIILETVKPALDGSGDIILRLYESKKADTAFNLKTALPVKKAWLCDMLENKEAELTLSEDGIKLDAGAFKILSVRLAL